MISVYDALGEPTRRRILDLLRERPRLVGELVEALGISQPGVSKHLRVLREANLVRVRQDAQRRWYELQPEPLKEVDQWLSAYRDYWEGRYSRMDTLLSELQQKDPQASPDQNKETGNE